VSIIALVVSLHVDESNESKYYAHTIGCGCHAISEQFAFLFVCCCLCADMSLRDLAEEFCLGIRVPVSLSNGAFDRIAPLKVLEHPDLGRGEQRFWRIGPGVCEEVHKRMAILIALDVRMRGVQRYPGGPTYAPMSFAEACADLEEVCKRGHGTTVPFSLYKLYRALTSSRLKESPFHWSRKSFLSRTGPLGVEWTKFYTQPAICVPTPP
jgi:hypothetical protein